MLYLCFTCFLFVLALVLPLFVLSGRIIIVPFVRVAIVVLRVPVVRLVAPVGVGRMFPFVVRVLRVGVARRLVMVLLGRLVLFGYGILCVLVVICVFVLFMFF